MPRPLHRNALLELLEGYGKRHPEESDCVARIRTLVAEHDDCFDRTCLPGHITASSWIVSHDGARALLTHHRKLGHWLQLGGHADGDGDVREVALREAREESGMQRFHIVGDGMPLDVDVHDIPARPGEPRHEHHDIRFLLVAEADQPLVISAESKDLRWFTPAELRPHLADESMARMARKAARWLKVASIA